MISMSDKANKKDEKININLFISYLLENSMQSCGIITDATKLSFDQENYCISLTVPSENIPDNNTEDTTDNIKETQNIKFELKDYLKSDGNISLSEIKNSAEYGSSYNYLTSYIKANKNNPEVLSKSISNLLSNFSALYDSNQAQISIGNSQQEILDKILSTPDGEELDGFICMTIHEFVMKALNDCGINSAILSGRTEEANHATLLYQLEDGKYIWNNYNKKLVVEASNIKDAAAQIYKQSGELNSSGYYQIQDGECSYQEFALKKEAAFGEIMDKRNYIQYTPFDNKLNEQDSNIDVNISLSNQGNITAETATSLKLENAELSLGLGYKKTKDSPLFYNSYSVGADIGYKQVKATTSGNKFFKAAFTTAYTTGEIGTVSYVKQNQKQLVEATGNIKTDVLKTAAEHDIDLDPEIIDKAFSSILKADTPTMDNPQYLSSFVNLGTGFSSKLKSSEKMTLSHAFQGSLFGGMSFDLNSPSFGGDARVLAEEGLNLQNRAGQFTFDNTISAGTGLDLRLTGGAQKGGVQPIIKLNAASGVEYNNSDNFKLAVQGKAYMTTTRSAKETGLEAGICSHYKPNYSKVTFYGQANTVFENQKLTLGGFNEKTENKVKLNVNAGALINPDLAVYAGYSRNIDKLNNRENYSTFTIGCKMNF